MFWENNDNQFNRRGRSVGFPGVQVVVLIGVMIATALGAFAAGYVAARPAAASSGKHVFDEAWQIIERQFYYPKPPESERTYAAINAVIATLKDPHTLLLQPVQAEREVRVMRGQVGGVGIVVAQDETTKAIIVGEARRGWPAEQAGVRAGDIIIAVDGVDVTGKELSEAANLIRGELDTEVTLTVRRDGAARPLDFKMKRGQINVYGTMLADDIAYLSMTIFNETAPADIEKFLKELLPQNPRALILDLRGNGGGFLNESLDIADMFLPKGLIATEKLFNGENKRFTAKDGGLAEQIPMVVLVDGGSASASEIVAGALQDRGRAVLIGQRTYGKGSVQTIHTLSDGSQLRVTSGAWYTPNEKPIQPGEGKPGGLAPDVTVPLPDEPTPGVDPVLDAALEYILYAKEIF
jgi:carboxyl-terminal processing protease